MCFRSKRKVDHFVKISFSCQFANQHSFGDMSGTRIICVEMLALENNDHLDIDTDDFVTM